MFGANFFKVRKAGYSPFLSLKGKKSFILDIVNEEKDGQLVVTEHKRPYNTNEPLTPQSGVACKMNHLPFMFKANMQMSSVPAYLDLKGSNPFETCRNVAGLARDFRNNNVKQSIKEDKK